MENHHKHHDKGRSRKVTCAVITVSDTRNKETDKSGKLIHTLLEAANHKILMYEITPDSKEEITRLVEKAINNQAIEAVIVNGGTGISYRDVTIESVKPLLTKELPGFGELFRYLSYEYDIGSSSMMSRAISGVANNRIVFAMPGSSGAVKLAMEKLVIPELGHTVVEINKDLTNEKDENQ